MEPTYYTGESAGRFLACAAATISKHVRPACWYYTTSGLRRPLFAEADLEAARDQIQGTPQHRGRVAPPGGGHLMPAYGFLESVLPDLPMPGAPIRADPAPVGGAAPSSSPPAGSACRTRRSTQRGGTDGCAPLSTQMTKG